MTYLIGRETFAIAACLAVLAWPTISQARSGGSQGGGHKEITISKTTDKSSPKMMQQTKTNKTKPHPTTQTSKEKKSIEVQDYGFGVSMPVTSSRSDGGGASTGGAKSK